MGMYTSIRYREYRWLERSLNPDLVLQSGYPALVFVLVGAAFGLPLPATLLLVGAGAYASTEELNLPLLLLTGLASVVVGDMAGYWVGRRGGEAVASRFGRWLKLTEAAPLHRSFQRWGVPTLFLTRFLLAPLGPSVSVLAGMQHYPFSWFARAAIAGEVVWVGLYGGIGYALGSGSSALALLLGDVTATLAIIALIAVLGMLVAHEARTRYVRRQLENSSN